MTEFDPYYRWLGISPNERPPNYYRLLGIEAFESDPRIIDSMANRHIDYLRQITDGPHVTDAQRLLNELAAARRCLLNPDKKATYDGELKEKLAGGRKALEAIVEQQSGGPEPLIGLSATPAHKETAKRKLRAKGPGRNTLRVAWAVACVVSAVVFILVLAWMFGSGDDRNGETANTTERQPVQFPPRPPRPKPGAEWDSQIGLALGVNQQTDQNVSLGPFKNAPTQLPAAPEAFSTDIQGPDQFAQEQNWPQSIPSDGLLLWLDASDSATVQLGQQSQVHRWMDKSGNECHACGDRTDCVPQLVPEALSSRAVVRFSGAHWLEIPGKSRLFQMNDRYTIVFVARGHKGTMLSKGTGESVGSLAISDGVTSLHVSGKKYCDPDDDSTVFRIRTIVADMEALRWFVDGMDRGMYPTSKHAVTNRSLLRLGCILRSGKGEQSFFWGDLAEVIVFGQPLEDEERVSLRGYLQDKWLMGSKTTFPFELEPAEDHPTGDFAVDDSVEAADDPVEALENSVKAADEPAHDSRSIATAHDTNEPERVPVANEDPAQDDDELYTLNVNLGGKPWLDPNGESWEESKDFDEETFGHEGGQPVKADGVQNPVASSAQRGLSALRAVVPDGVFEVVLFFSEHWTTTPQRRVFSVFVEQQPVHPKVFRAPGLHTPYIHRIPRVPVKDGRLDIDFYPANELASALLNGISIRQQK